MSIEKIVEKQQDDDMQCIDKFREYLLSHVSEKTANKHVSNIELYSHYHNDYVYDKSDINSLDDMNSYLVVNFLDSWVLCKTFPTSLYQLESYIGSFKKFHQWLVVRGVVSEKENKAFVSDLKQEKASIDKKWYKFLASNRQYIM